MQCGICGALLLNPPHVCVCVWRSGRGPTQSKQQWDVKQPYVRLRHSSVWWYSTYAWYRQYLGTIMGSNDASRNHCKNQNCAALCNAKFRGGDWTRHVVSFFSCHPNTRNLYWKGCDRIKRNRHMAFITGATWYSFFLLF